MSPDPSPTPLAPSQRRLQRHPDFTGNRLTRFRDVFIRHGLPGLLLGLALLTQSELRAALTELLAPAAHAPWRYAAAAGAILAALVSISVVLDRRPGPAQIGWMLYLLALSVWEEWIFRVALPTVLGTTGLGVVPAIVASNALFGAVHYFTLRWRFRWCVLAALGGLWFANVLQAGDLALVVALHWVSTWLNTPRPPGSGGRSTESN